jgi:hypothetical protein
MPWRLIYDEEFDRSLSAGKWEKYLKSATGKRYINESADIGFRTDMIEQAIKVLDRPQIYCIGALFHSCHNLLSQIKSFFNQPLV